jgi:hypothetical protein
MIDEVKHDKILKAYQDSLKLNKGTAGRYSIHIEDGEFDHISPEKSTTGLKLGLHQLHRVSITSRLQFVYLVFQTSSLLEIIVGFRNSYSSRSIAASFQIEQMAQDAF